MTSIWAPIRGTFTKFLISRLAVSLHAERDTTEMQYGANLPNHFQNGQKNKL